MLRRVGLMVSAICLICSSLMGCSTLYLKNGIVHFSKQEQWEPPVEEDKWASVGKIGRGGRALEDERDPLKGMLMSSEAQAIERNLGYK